MESNQQTTSTDKQTFDIRVALVGYVSVGKSTVLNALLGDKFSQVALNRTTAAINIFRITQPICLEEGWPAIGDGGEFEEAGDVHKEILEDNQKLRSSGEVKEKTFDIRIGHSIFKMRKDTRLVLIDIPGINEAETSKKYKDYVESNWKTFDCVVVVMDAIQGVNTEEQVDLLKFVQKNNLTSKDIPTIVLGNKMDDLNDEDTIQLIEETCSKTIQIFGNVDCRSIPNKDDNADEVETIEIGSNTTDKKVRNTAFIPLSAKNAFTYMKAGSIKIDQLNDPKYSDLVNKIGHDEYGRKWSSMRSGNKIDAVLEIIRDPFELEKRLAGTNFSSFLAVLSDFLGGDARQQEILMRQADVELEGISPSSIGKRSISRSIFEAFKRRQSIGQADDDRLKNHFWKVYYDCENRAFASTRTCYLEYMEHLFMELDTYNKLASALDWIEESVRVIDAMRHLLRRQLSFLLKNLEEWCFESYCARAGGSIRNTNEHFSCKNCRGGSLTKSYRAQNGSWVNLYCYRLVKNDTAGYPSYFICGEKTEVRMEKGWKNPKGGSWGDVSPQDWIVILESLSLVWNQSRFVEDFGPEKVRLSAALTPFQGTFSFIPGLNLDNSVVGTSPVTRLFLHAYRKEIEDFGPEKLRRLSAALTPFQGTFSFIPGISLENSVIGTSPVTRLFLHAYREEIHKRGKDSPIFNTVKMPGSLNDPSHWGHLAWKYISFCNDRKGY